MPFSQDHCCISRWHRSLYFTVNKKGQVDQLPENVFKFFSKAKYLESGEMSTENELK